MNRKQRIVAWIAIITGITISIIGIIVYVYFSLGWSPFIYRLHRETGGVWKDFGIQTDYVEWKITRQERERENKFREGLVVWKANFRNVSDKKKSISITFELYDKDNFILGWDKIGKSLLEDKELLKLYTETVFVKPEAGKGIIELAELSYIPLSPNEEKVITGKLWIPKQRALSAYKSELKLGVKEVNE